MRGDAPIGRKWDSRTLPWHWSYLRSLHLTCESVLNDPTLRDTENEPPPKDMWFDREELDGWRKTWEAERKKEYSR